MSKNILETLANSLQDMHDNHEPLSWALLASAIDTAIKTAPEGVQDTTDDTYATAYRKTVDRVQMLHEAVFGKEFTFTNSNTVRDALKRIGEKFAEVSGSKVDDDKIAELVYENVRLKTDLKTTCEELIKAKAERDTLKEQVVELAKGERGMVKFQEQVMNLFPEISKAEDYDPFNTLQKVYEQAMGLQVKVAELGAELKAYKNPWLSPGDKVVFNLDIQADTRHAMIYACKDTEAEVVNYDPAKRRARLQTPGGVMFYVEQDLFDKKV